MERSTRNTILIVSSVLILIGVGVIIINTSTDGKLKYPTDAKWPTDAKTLKMVDELHPKVKQRVADFFTDIEKKGLIAVGTSGLRTSAQQAGLKLENSSNATAGMSDHEYGFAIDMNVLKDGKSFLKKANTSKEWIDSGVVDIAKRHNLKWGGSGAFGSYHDPIHFYDDFDIPAKDMQKRKLAGRVDKQGYLLV